MKWSNKQERNASKNARRDARINFDDWGERYGAHFAPRGGFQVHKHTAKPSAKWAVMGIELETEPMNGGHYRAMLRAGGNYYDLCAFPCEDGSLNAGGIEWKTDAGTLPWLFALVDKLYTEMDANGYTARYGGGYNCGLHVHISKWTFGVTEFAWQSGAYKMAVAIDRFRTFFEGVAGRNFQSWAPSDGIRSVWRVSDRDINEQPVRNALADHQAYFAFTKYAAVNVAHESTIELRIGSGRETAYAVKQYLIRVNALVNLVKERTLSASWFENCTREEFMTAFYEKEQEVMEMVAGL